MGRNDLHPTGLHRGSLSAQLLDFMNQVQLDLLGLAAAADVIAADCRFNSWAAEMKRVETDIDKWMRLLDAAEANAQRCHAAMAALSAGGLGQAFRSEMAAVATALNSRFEYPGAEPFAQGVGQKLGRPSG